jgi:hypothetical protein
VVCFAVGGVAHKLTGQGSPLLIEGGFELSHSQQNPAPAGQSGSDSRCVSIAEADPPFYQLKCPRPVAPIRTSPSLVSVSMGPTATYTCVPAIR